MKATQQSSKGDPPRVGGTSGTTRRNGGSRAERSTAQGTRSASMVLLRRYRRRRSVAVRNELIEQFRQHVEAIARTLCMRLPKSVDVDDLVHAGVWGLIQAIDSFDIDRGTSFEVFMRRRVRGAMLDELRNMDYLPRLYRHRMKALDAAEQRLRDTLAREPSDAELAEELGISESRLRVSYGRAPTLRPLDPIRGGFAESGDRDGMDSLVDDDWMNPLDALDRQDMLEKIEASLQPIEWAVLRMHYIEGMSGKDVAAKLRLSAARICQIHVRVLSRLKARLRA